MNFETAFGHIRSICAQTPAMEALTELENVLWSVWDQDAERVASEVLPYTLHALASWPGHLKLHELRGDATPNGIPILTFLERAFESDVCVRSDFLLDYLMGHECRLALNSNENDKVEVPTGLTASNHFNYDVKHVEPAHPLFKHTYTERHKTLQLQYQLIHKFLVRYLLTYEHDAQDWETLHTRLIAHGNWQKMASFGEVEPQHGLMPCELAFIEKHSGLTFPSVVREFYRLFGRLVLHGPDDRAVNPYEYVTNATLTSEAFVIFVRSQRRNWVWGYRRGDAPDPRMVLFQGENHPHFSQRLVQVDCGVGYTGCAAYAYQTRLSDFACASRDPHYTE